MKKNISFVASALLAAFPLAVAAQGLNNILRLAETAVEIVDIGILIVFTIAVLVFGWGIVKYLTAAGDATKLAAARGFLWWGILGVFVLAAMYGLVLFVADALGIDDVGGGAIQPPEVRR
ncbi:MAG: hypothetical protein A2679_00860 [Candidatus Sungbacteria bacterium RIFCSPHIGHO2_01_FULL_54_26]|nr:MAG: hypothetical protein A2679_00860 [Candidatus Sungbacteria bacterium RIFCSPHIGHO2_01_FULL_54_26]OHA03840.1 MAG: hypothetical protein A3C92_04050 [Candidatus Sungbacteria bacterium RIFCSPHIGHO2_02_FULL_53_17]